MEDLDKKIIELMDLFDDEQVTTADQIKRPEKALEKQAIDDFMKRNPQADGGRIGLKRGTDGPGSGTRTDLDYINLTRLQNAKSKNVRISDASKFKYLPNQENITYTDYKDKKTGKVTRKYNVRIRQNVDGVQKVLTKGDEFQNITSLNKAKKIRDDFRKANPKNIQPRDPLKDYLSKDERRKYEVLKQGRMIKFGAGKGSVVHHMLPLAGKADVTTSDLAKISAKMNTNLSQFDKPMNKLVNEAYALDFSKEGSLKRLDEINKELAGYVKQSVEKLGPQYKGLLGFNKLTPVLDTFDKKGNQVFEEVPQGLNFKKSIAGKKGGEAVRNIKTKDIQKMVSDAPLTKELKNVGQRLAAIGCPGKAKGGRVEFNLGGSPECITRGLENLRTGNMSPGAKANAKQLVKNPTALQRFAKFAVGPLGIPTEIAIGGFFAATDYATGANKDEIISNLTFGGFGKSMNEQAQERNPLFNAAKNLDKTYSRYLAGLDKQGNPLQRGNPRGMRKITTDKDVFKAMEPFQRVNPQLEEGQMFDLDMFNKALATPQELQEEKTQRALDRGFYTPGDRSIDPFQAAGGGIAKQAGDSSGPPPESGPNPQGLQGLMKRGMKI
jgi:hypothetical protein